MNDPGYSAKQLGKIKFTVNTLCVLYSPFHLPEVPSTMLDQTLGQRDLFVALVSSIAALFSTVGRQAFVWNNIQYCCSAVYLEKPTYTASNTKSKGRYIVERESRKTKRCCLWRSSHWDDVMGTLFQDVIIRIASRSIIPVCPCPCCKHCYLSSIVDDTQYSQYLISLI